MKPDTRIIQSTLATIPEIAACYLFGSAAKAEAVVNDIDLMVLLRPDANIDKSMWAVIEKVSAALQVPADLIDVLVFDLSLADPQVLYRAVNEGVLLKNEDPDLLSDRIEALSLYLLENEHVLKEARRLGQELVEEACNHGCRSDQSLS